jgi:hypothetical protein
MRPCFRVSREFHRKKEAFFEEKRCFWKKPTDLTRKRREFFAAIFCIFEKSGIFSDFEFLKQPHYWTILKNT